MAAEAAAHAAITVGLVHYNAPPWALRAWELVTIGIDGSTVARNASIGLATHF